jgi:hypothetical protein
VAAARGDGVVAVFDVDSPPPAPSKRGGGGSSSSSSVAPAGSGVGRAAAGCSVTLGAADGGHSKPACAVQFAPGTGGRLLASGGQDRRLVLWDWTRKLGRQDAEQEGGAAACWQRQHRFKVNALACRAAGGALELLVADVSKSVACYAVAV